MTSYMLTACPHCNAVRVEVAVIPVLRPPDRGLLTSGALFDWSACTACLQGLADLEKEHAKAVKDLAALNKIIENAGRGKDEP